MREEILASPRQEAEKSCGRVRTCVVARARVTQAALFVVGSGGIYGEVFRLFRTAAPTPANPAPSISNVIGSGIFDV